MRAGWRAAWEDIQYLRSTGRSHTDGYADSVTDFSLAAELHGFKWLFYGNTGGHLAAGARWQAFAPGNSGTYHLYQCRYGVKWPNGVVFAVLMAGMRRSYPPQSLILRVGPPSAAVLCALSARFAVRSVMSHAEEGCGFCGYSEYDQRPVNRP